MVRRKLFPALLEHLPKKEFSIITGARQTGKSTLLRQLEDHCKEAGFPVVFLNLENKSILAELNLSPLNLLKFLPETDRKVVILVDEVQYLDDPSNYLKLLYDEYAAKIKIVATGSSAFYMNDRFRDSLAGRKKIFPLYTCAFDEYLEISGKQELHEELGRIQAKTNYRSTQIELLLIEWEKFLLYGGYPAVITEPDSEAKIDRLKELRDSFVKRDILESGVQNENAFYKLFQLLASQTGNLVNVNELASTIQIKNETVTNYLAVLQQCFHISLVKPYYNNVRKELTKMQKVYLLDTGMRNSLLNNFRPLALRTDKGEIWENMVYRLLTEKYGMDEINYWRTSAGNEIDFMMPRITHPKAIEAKYDKVHANINKYKLFTSAYPEIPMGFSWMSPGDEDFFRRIF